MAADFVEKLPEGLKNLAGRKSRRLLTSNEIDIPRTAEPATVVPEIFADPPLDHISLHGVADAFADRDSKSGAPLSVSRK